MLSAAKHLSRYAQRCFAALSMTGRDLCVDEDLSSAFEPCLRIIFNCVEASLQDGASTQLNVFLNLEQITYIDKMSGNSGSSSHGWTYQVSTSTAPLPA